MNPELNLVYKHKTMREEILKSIEAIKISIRAKQKDQLTANQTPVKIAETIQQMENVIIILDNTKEQIREEIRNV